MNSTITIAASLCLGVFVIALVLGGLSLLFLLFCLGCVGSDFFAASARRAQSIVPAPRPLKLVPPNHRVVQAAPQPTRRIAS